MLTEYGKFMVNFVINFVANSIGNFAVKFIGTLTLLCAAAVCAKPDSPSATVEEQDPNAYTVQSYPADSKQYRYVALDNGLRALLVSDAEALQAAAALRVNVGSFQDPEGWDGLAHFLEHMLFLGTEKYPAADDYVNYIQAHGGQRNATTDYHGTQFFFAVNRDYFEGALDRFAQFFIAPTFNEEYVERERNAVHSEYFTRIDNDGIRGWEVFENVINPRHPAARFNAGNLDTLADKPGQTARAALIDFYETYYSADRMTLVMVSNESLDDLEQLARDKFSAVPVLTDVPETVFPPLFETGQLPRIVEIKPVQEQRQLSLTFPIRSAAVYSREYPLGFIIALMNARADNSLQERLKAKGWILDMQASSGLHYGGDASFIIGVHLTEAGMRHQDEIIAALFEQIALVKEYGVEEWRYDEMKNMTEMGLHFAEDRSFGLGDVVALSGALYYVLPRDLISSRYQRFDADVIHAVLDDLRSDNVVVTLTSPEVEPDRTTEFYGAEYRSYQPAAERVARWSESRYPDLALPEQNPFVPESFALEDVVSAEKPVLLSDSGSVELWHYPNIEDGLPSATVLLAIDRAERLTIEQALIAQFYTTLMSEQLKVLSYNATRAGMSYGIGPDGVTFSGYSDKLPELSDRVLEEILRPRFTQDLFDRLMESTERNYRNYSKMPPLVGVQASLEQLLKAGSHSRAATLAAIRRITLEDVLAAPEWLYGEARLQMLAAGNVTESQARDFAHRIVETLGITGTDREITHETRVVRVNKSEPPHDVLVVEFEHQDAAVLRYYQGRDVSGGEQLALAFLGKMINQYYFNELRTEQQLGYIVQAGFKQLGRVPGLVFLAQSPTVDAGTIEAATDDFLPSFKEILANMTAADFAPLKQGMLEQLKRSLRNRSERIGVFWRELRLGYPEFNSREEAIAAVEAVSLEDVRDAYQAVVFDEARAVSVIAPGALGGVEGTIESAQVYQQGKEVIVRE